MDTTKHEIKATRQYDLFKLRADNRKLSPNHVKRLSMMLEEYNDLHLNPIIVNSDMEVVDGQHRLAAAQAIGETVWYVVDEQSRAHKMIELNTSHRGWRAEDYLNYWIQHGKPDYRMLKDFCLKNDMQIVTGMHWISSACDSSRHNFNTGQFKFCVTDEKKRAVQSFQKICTLMRERNYKPIKIYRQMSFHRACRAVLTNPFISHERLLAKLVEAPYTIKYCNTVREYVMQLVDIYGYKMKTKEKPRVIHDGDKFEIAM